MSESNITTENKETIAETKENESVEQSLKRDHQSTKDDSNEENKNSKKIKTDRNTNENNGKQTLYRGRYTKWKKHSRLFGTSEHVKGFLVTCDKAREAQSIGETLIFLNAYADMFFSDTVKTDENKKEKKPEDIKKFLCSRGIEVDEEEEDDEEEEEEEETEPNKPKQAKRFELINAACGGLYVVSILHESIDPITFISAIIVDLHKRFNKDKDDQDRFANVLSEPVKEMLKNAKPVDIPARCLNIKFTNRLIPFQRSTVVSLETDVLPIMTSLIEKSFDENKPETFAIELRSRNNPSFNKDEFISKIAGLVKSPHKVDLKNADKVIIVENIKSAVTMSIVSHPKAFFRYNIKEAIFGNLTHGKAVQKQQKSN